MKKRIIRRIITWSIVTVIYTGSCGYNYNWFSAAYSSDGIWSSLSPSYDTIFWTFFPIANTAAAFITLFYPPTRYDIIKKDGKITLPDRFFEAD